MIETTTYTVTAAELDILQGLAASAAPSKHDFVLFPSPEASQLMREAGAG